MMHKFRVGLHDLLAMGTLVRKAFTTDVGQMQWQRHHMTVWMLTPSEWCTNFRVGLHDLLAMGTPVRKAFTTDVERMHWQRHHMTVVTFWAKLEQEQGSRIRQNIWMLMPSEWCTKFQSRLTWFACYWNAGTKSIYKLQQM